jgi:hypothetical protein
MYISEGELEEFTAHVDHLVESTKLPYLNLYTVEEVESSDSGPLGLENIVGFGVGEKQVGGIRQGVLAVQAHVIRKVPPRLVARGSLVEELVSEYIGTNIVSDVLEVGRPQLFHHRAKNYAPLVPAGVSVANAAGRWGTLYQVALIMPRNWWGVAGRRP